MNILVQTTCQIWVWQAKYFVATGFPMDLARGVTWGSWDASTLVPFQTFVAILGQTLEWLRHRGIPYVPTVRMVDIPCL
jgi:hypothetical protein